MLCEQFEDSLTDYLEGSLTPETQRACAEHILRCPVCHDLLSEVKNTLQSCRLSTEAVGTGFPAGLEARILQRTAPDTMMSCREFEEYLTDYLDGFLPAALYHRWERHAALCEQCTELPGAVVRSIGACYSYIQDEMPMPARLHERILQATLGTTHASELRPSFMTRSLSGLRMWLDRAFSPQLATVATMLLVAVLVGTTTISDDGTIGGMYRTGLRLAAQTYLRGATTAARNTAISDEVKQVADTWMHFVNTAVQNADANTGGNRTLNGEGNPSGETSNEAQPGETEAPPPAPNRDAPETEHEPQNR